MKKTELSISSPCQVDWASMTPADKGRFCASCKKVVHDLSRMTESEARTLVRTAGGGELCVRYVYDREGKVFFAPDKRMIAPTLLNRARRATLAAAALALPVALAACDVIPGVGGTEMGSMAYDPDFDAGDTADAAADAAETSPTDDGGDAGADAQSDADTDGGDADPDGGIPIL